jgi:hypothetical protein
VVCGRWPTLFILQRQVLRLPSLFSTREEIVRSGATSVSKTSLLYFTLKATRLSAHPAGDPQRATSYSTPTSARNRRQPSHLARVLRPIAATYLQTLFWHGGRKQVSIRSCLVRFSQQFAQIAPTYTSAVAPIAYRRPILTCLC